MKARALFAVLWLVSCGTSADGNGSISSGGGTFGTSGTSMSGGSNGPSGPPATDEPTPAMTNTNVCGDGGVCFAGECCGGLCCAVSQMCCSGHCVTPSLLQPTCGF